MERVRPGEVEETRDVYESIGGGNSGRALLFTHATGIPPPSDS